MRIVEEQTMYHHIECDCGNMIHKDNYHYDHEFPELTVKFSCRKCRHKFTYVGKGWDSLKLSSKINFPRPVKTFSLINIGGRNNE